MRRMYGLSLKADGSLNLEDVVIAEERKRASLQ